MSELLTPGAPVRVSRADGSDVGLQHTVDSEGRLRLRNLRPGRYVARFEDGLRKLFHVPEGIEEHVVEHGDLEDAPPAPASELATPQDLADRRAAAGLPKDPSVHGIVADESHDLQPGGPAQAPSDALSAAQAHGAGFTGLEPPAAPEEAAETAPTPDQVGATEGNAGPDAASPPVAAGEQEVGPPPEGVEPADLPADDPRHDEASPAA